MLAGEATGSGKRLRHELHFNAPVITFLGCADGVLAHAGLLVGTGGGVGVQNAGCFDCVRAACYF